MWRDPKDFEQIGKMAREWAKNMRLEDFEYLHRSAREAEKMRPSPQQMESMHQQARLVQEMFSDPKIRLEHSDTARMLEQRHSALAQLPDAATQQRLLEAARYFASEEFRATRESVLQLAQSARQHLGTEGIAAAQRITTRRTAATGDQEQALERIKAGQVTELLEEATQLATSQEVREAIESTDPDALVRLDKEQGTAVGDVRAEPLTEVETAHAKVYEEAYPELTKEDWLRLHEDALILLWSLEVWFAGLMLTPGGPAATPFAIAVGGLIAIVSISERVIARRED